MPLNKSWVTINKRPFAIEPLTGIMMPDGIFDAAISHQQIACHISNKSGLSLVNLRVRIKSIGDPGILLTSNDHLVTGLGPNSVRLLTWDANFSNAKPGKHLIEFEIVPWSVALNFPIYKPQIVRQTIFVTATIYDEATKTYLCSVPEGELQVQIKSIIAPTSLKKWSDPKYARKHSFHGPLLLKSLDLNVVPTKPFEGQFGPIPFNDPWWKIIAVVVCVVAIIAAIVAAILGFGTAYFGLKGEDFDDLDSGEPTCNNCELDTWGGDEQFSVAGILSIISMLALAVALMDEIDPWRRGQSETIPSGGEKTTGELVTVKLEYLQSPIPGSDYPINVEWDYQRTTDRGKYDFAVSETNRNSHSVSNVTIWSSHSTSFAKETIEIYATVSRPNSKAYRGDELYLFAIVRGPNNLSTRISLVDNGTGADKQSRDGVFSGKFNPAEIALSAKTNANDAIGNWFVYVVIQDVNDATAGMPPLEAATHIGSYVLHAPFPLNIDGTISCPDSSDVTILVT